MHSPGLGVEILWLGHRTLPLTLRSAFNSGVLNVTQHFQWAWKLSIPAAFCSPTGSLDAEGVRSLPEKAGLSPRPLVCMQFREVPKSTSTQHWKSCP